MILQVILTVLAANMLGMIWYGPLFGSTWAPLAYPGRNMRDIGKDGTGMAMAIAMGGSACVAAILNHLLG